MYYNGYVAVEIGQLWRASWWPALTLTRLNTNKHFIAIPTTTPSAGATQLWVFVKKTLYKLMVGEEVGLDEIIKILFGVML